MKGLEDQARLYCKGIQENLVPQIYYVTDTKRSGQVQLFAFTVFRTTEVKRDTSRNVDARLLRHILDAFAKNKLYL